MLVNWLLTSRAVTIEHIISPKHQVCSPAAGIARRKSRSTTERLLLKISGTLLLGPDCTGNQAVTNNAQQADNAKQGGHDEAAIAHSVGATCRDKCT